MHVHLWEVLWSHGDCDQLLPWKFFRSGLGDTKIPQVPTTLARGLRTACSA